MLTFNRTGRIADVIAAMRDVPERVVPLATAKALTFAAQAGQRSIVAAMSQSFDRPTPYTLRSTRIESASPEKLQARVAIKDQSSGTLPQDYLFPEVYGGERREKRFERSLRYAGILKEGERAMPGQVAPLDAYGNFKPSELRRILAAVRGSGAAAQRRGAKTARRGRRGRRAAQYFAGVIRGTDAVWRRDGREVRPVLVFVRGAPRYRRRLDFEGLARAAAEAEFEPAFRRALSSATRN